MDRTVTLFGKPLILIGSEIKVGEFAPDFVALDKDLNSVRLSDFRGKIKLISSTPSLDTPVCDLQLRTFNQKASQIPERVVLINISMDLPFALGRFCSHAGIEQVLVLSDHKEASFGLNYGLLIRDLRLLARAVIIIDQRDRIRYIEVVPELSTQPDYDRALTFLETLLKEKTMKALIISADNFEDTELLYPLYRLTEEGYQVDLASLTRAKLKGKHGYQIEANLSIDEIIPENYDLLLLPGGKAPETLRKDNRVIEVVRKFYELGKIVGAICHGPQILISAGLLERKRATAYKSVQKELQEAGALCEDKEVVVDGNIITSRMPSDLPFFMKEIIRALSN